MLGALLPDLWPWLLGALTVVGGLFGFGRVQKAKGKAEVIHKAKERDHEKASDIRDRVERDLPDRVRRYDDAGYRD
jgi:hypothetical protein